MSHSAFFCIVCFSLTLRVLFSPDCGYGSGDALDEVLGGFDEEIIDSSGNAFDEALGGFDEPQGDELGTVLDGFAGQGTSGEEAFAEKTSRLPSWLSLSGGLGLASSVNFSHDAPDPRQTDHRGLAKFKVAADLTADVRFSDSWQSSIELKGFYDFVYDMKGREEYTRQVLGEYVKELEFGEAWLQGSVLPSLDVKIGRQIVVWGKSDNIRVADVLNPLDNREPGLVDIRDLRLPVTMSKVDYYQGDWNVTGMVIHENRFNKEPVYGNDFYMPSFPGPSEDEPSTAWRNQEFAVAVNGIFSGWDLSFYGARLFDDMAHLEQTAIEPVRRHSRIGMAGMAVNVALGSWLVKGETAWLDGIDYSIPVVGEKSRFDLLLGAEFSGIDETVLSFEVANRHILAYDDRLQEAPVYVQQDEAQLVFRASRDFFHDTLTVTGLVSVFVLSDNDGAFERFTAEYEFTQDINLTSGLIFYQNGDKAAFRDIGDNDRIFVEIRYSF